MLIWDTNPRSPPSFSPIGLRTAEKFQFLSLPDRLQTDRHESQEAGKTIVRFDLSVTTDKNALITEISPIFLYFWFCDKKCHVKVTSGPRLVHNSTNLMLQTMIVFHNQLIRAYVHFQWYIPNKIGDILSTNQVLLPKWRWNRCVT
jgi:hypothetical protein